MEDSLSYLDNPLVSENLVLGVTLRWTSIPSMGEVDILLVALYNRNWRRPDRPFGSYRDVTIHLKRENSARLHKPAKTKIN